MVDKLQSSLDRGSGLCQLYLLSPSTTFFSFSHTLDKSADLPRGGGTGKDQSSCMNSYHRCFRTNTFECRKDQQIRAFKGHRSPTCSERLLQQIPIKGPHHTGFLTRQPTFLEIRQLDARVHRCIKYGYQACAGHIYLHCILQMW